MKNKQIYFHDILLRDHNIDVSCFEESFLHKSLQARMKKVNCTSIEEYNDFLQLHEAERNKLLRSLQIVYSAFFRNTLSFAVMEHLLLPDIISAKKGSKEIRIWSAACAAGQEAYSLAILLQEHVTYKNNDFCYRIFATDRDERNIKLAQKGGYHPDHLANISLKHMEKWFIQEGGHYSVKPGLKKHIEFSVFDLLGRHNSPPESIFGEFDLVVCANLLFYYKAEYRKKIMNKLAEAMADNAYLIVGETEREILMNFGFKEVYPYSAIFRKI